MSVVSPPPVIPPEQELEALIREARARQRRRWIGAAVVVAAMVGASLGLNAVLPGGGAHAKQGDGSRPLAVGSVPRCSSDQLAVSAPSGGVYTGHREIDFTFRNVSGAACALRGWPRVQLVMGNGRRVVPRERRLPNLSRRSDQPVRMQTVVLRPHGVASFYVVVVNQVGRSGPEPQVFCSWSRAILLSPPGGVGAPVRLAQSLTTCGLLVGPLFAGRPGRYSFP
jgi:hypothetical protein